MADQIIPIPIMEQSCPNNETILSIGLIVCGRLNPDVLRNALTELVDRWRILGSRIVRNKKVLFKNQLLFIIPVNVMRPGNVRVSSP